QHLGAQVPAVDHHAVWSARSHAGLAERLPVRRLLVDHALRLRGQESSDPPGFFDIRYYASMVTRDHESDEAFREQARTALTQAAAGVGWEASPALGSGDGHDRARRRRLDRMLAERGWAGIAWPVEYGGRGESLRRQAIFAEEASRLGLATPYNRVALGIV